MNMIYIVTLLLAVVWIIGLLKMGKAMSKKKP